MIGAILRTYIIFVIYYTLEAGGVEHFHGVGDACSSHVGEPVSEALKATVRHFTILLTVHGWYALVVDAKLQDMHCQDVQL